MEFDGLYYYEVGIEKYEKGDIESALKNFQKSLELQEHFKTYERLYHALKDLGRIEEAREAITKAYNLNDRNDKVAFEYVKFLLEDKNSAIAKKVLNALLKRNPTYGPAKKLKKNICFLEENGNGT
jgi:tetratricopeptide (TPR) repeat protein